MTPERLTIYWLPQDRLIVPSVAEINAGTVLGPPWQYPDRNPMPQFVLFSWLDRVVGRLRSVANRFRPGESDWDDE